MTPHRFTAAAVLVVVLTAAGGAACSSDDALKAEADSAATTASSSPANAESESAFCRRSIEWNVEALTPFDESDPEATHEYSDASVAFLDAQVEDAPAELVDDVRSARDAVVERLVPVLEKYEYSIERLMTEGTPEEQAILADAPPDVHDAQDRVQVYEAEVCGSQGPLPAEETFAGPADENYCAAVAEFDGAVGEAFVDGPDPEALRAIVESDDFDAGLTAEVDTAPAEIHDDGIALADWTRERHLPLLERYDYDLPRLLLEGTAAERRTWQYSDPEIADAYARVVAYEEQLCGGQG